MALVKQEPTCNDIATIKQEQADLQLQTTSSLNETIDAATLGQEDDNGRGGDFEPSSKPLGPEDMCDLNPEFAVICSFIIAFGDKIDIELDIEKLRSAIEDQSSIDEELINIHVKLLKKLRRYFVRDQWEKALIRFASEYSYEHAYEIELFGYQKTRPSVKLELLRRLLDVQFQCDQKFKASVNLCEADELRVPPLGRDVHGNTYWKKNDKQGNFRVYREEPLNYRSWKTVCNHVAELQDLIYELDTTQNERVKGEPSLDPYNPLPEIFPEYFKVKEINPNLQIIEDKVAPSIKKSRPNGRRKNAPSSLPVLEEDDSIHGNESNSIETPPGEDRKPLDSKPQINLEMYLEEDTVAVHDIAISSSSESQVKSTLENIINKVVASFEFIMRPLSRNSNDSQANEVVSRERPKKKSAPRRKREKVQNEVVPRRSSSRIQQLQIKKQTEQEEEMKKMIERQHNRVQEEIFADEEDSGSRTSNKNEMKKCERTSNGKKGRKSDWRKGRGKKKLSWDKDDSDLSSISSPTESDDDDFEDPHKFIINSNNLDDEFACEDEDTNIEPVIIRRARTARQSTALSETGHLNETTIIEEDKPCGRCDKSNDPEWILLCDMCDGGYHTSCTLPPLMLIPDGDWYCPSCEHKMLLTNLRDFHMSLSQILATKEEEKRKRQLTSKRKPAAKAEPACVVQEQTNGRRAKDILNELNDPIALQRLDECLGSESGSISSIDRSRDRFKKGRNTKKKRSQSNRYDSKRPKKSRSRDHMSDTEEFDSESSDEIAHLPSEDELPKTRRARASVSYKFKEYDALIKSAIRGESEEEDPTSEDEEESAPHNYGRGKDMATIEALAYQQENNLTQEPVPPPSKPSKARRKGRRLNDLDALSEAEDVTSDESFQASATEAEDAELTEEALSEETDTSIDEIVGSSKKKRKKHIARRNSYESDDSDYQPNRSRRRATTQRFNYAESSAEEEEGSDFGERAKKVKKTILSSDEETEASWKSDPTKSDEDDDEDPPSPFDDDPVDDADPADDEDEELAQDYETESSTHSSPPAEIPPLDETIDEIAAPLYRPKEIVTDAMTSDPIDQLNQYCMDRTGESTMYNSFTQILSKESPPHPPFYGDNDPKQGANEKQKKTVEQTIPSH